MPKGVYVRNPLLRPQTFKECEHCGVRFGPVDHLSQRYCRQECKAMAQRKPAHERSSRRTITVARSAQSLLRYHVQAGHIVRPTRCEECGRDGCNIEGAHKDYAFPLDVRWLCISCHRKWDRADPKGATVKLTGKKAERVTA